MHYYQTEIQAMIYNFGVHLEFKSAEADSSPSSSVAFGVVEFQTEVIRLLTVQVAALSASADCNHRRGNRKNERFPPRNDRDRPNTRSNDRDRPDSRN